MIAYDATVYLRVCDCSLQICLSYIGSPVHIIYRRFIWCHYPLLYVRHQELAQNFQMLQLPFSVSRHSAGSHLHPLQSGVS